MRWRLREDAGEDGRRDLEEKDEKRKTRKGEGIQPEGGYQRASALSTGHTGRNAARHSPSFNYGAVATRDGKKGSEAPRKSNFKSSARGPTADLIKFSRKKKRILKDCPTSDQ